MSVPLKTLLAAVSVAGSLLSNTRARADEPVALVAQAPVALAACQIDFSFRTVSAWGPSIAFVNGVDLRFSNQRQIEANEVDVDLAYNGRETTIVDRGRFAPTTTIAHSFDTLDGTVYGGSTPDRCRVVAVHYVDGLTWHE